MNAEQYHLCRIAEECTEVAQRALKAQQFGLDEVQSGQELNNMARLVDEFHDLFVTFDNFMALVDSDYATLPKPEKRLKRIAKMQTFLQLSKDLNQVAHTTII